MDIGEEYRKTSVHVYRFPQGSVILAASGLCIVGFNTTVSLIVKNLCYKRYITFFLYFFGCPNTYRPNVSSAMRFLATLFHPCAHTFARNAEQVCAKATKKGPLRLMPASQRFTIQSFNVRFWLSHLLLPFFLCVMSVDSEHQVRNIFCIMKQKHTWQNKQYWKRTTHLTWFRWRQVAAAPFAVFI